MVKSKSDLETAVKHTQPNFIADINRELEAGDAWASPRYDRHAPPEFARFFIDQVKAYGRKSPSADVRLHAEAFAEEWERPEVGNLALLEGYATHFALRDRQMDGF